MNMDIDERDLARKEYGTRLPSDESDTRPFTNKEEIGPRPHSPDGSTDHDTTNTNARDDQTLAQTATNELPHLRRKETRLAVKDAHPWQHLGITLGLPMILLFDVVVPCIIYYTWHRAQLAAWNNDCAAESYPADQPCPLPPPAQFNKDILGAAIASFGIGELWILLARVYRLFAHADECAPLLSTSRWQLDATSWVYAAAMIVALIPFLVGSALEMPKLYLYGPSFLMGFLGVMMVVTTVAPFQIPVKINSQPKGTMLRPFIYYAAEDFMAVDGLQDREFRTRYNERYETNPMFRQLFYRLTIWWTLGVMVYIGSVSAVIWTMEFQYAFGLSLGVLFSYIACWAVVTFVWVKLEMAREHEAYERGDLDV